MTKSLQPDKGVSRSGRQLLRRAMRQGFVPSPTSTGPKRFLRQLAARKGKR